MKVRKRNGKVEDVNLNKITSRLKILANNIEPQLLIDPTSVAVKVVGGIYDGVSTTELDNLASETSAVMTSIHPDYGELAARIEISNLHKETSDTFSDKIEQLFNIGIISDKFLLYVLANKEKLDAMIDYKRDYAFDYFGVRTLKKSYLLKKKDGSTIIERPQDMWMRVAAFIHMATDDAELSRTRESYDLMSQRYFTHATPTLFNSGTTRPQLSSCFLLDVDGDSIDGIYKTLSDCAKISQSAGGIGLAIHKIRSKGSYIAGTNGHSNGIIPMLRVFDSTARYVDQGGGKRKGSIAIYLEPWHADIIEWLDLKKNTGKEELRARDLFYGLWIPDIFMRRVEEDGDWTLFDPKDTQGLIEAYGEEFDSLYRSFETSTNNINTSDHVQGLVTGRIIKGKTIKARDLWNRIITAQIETGTPYMLYKDACNLKSNQQNLGTIKSSNLCTEILEYTSPEEVAVCNLASLSLPSFITNNAVDYERLYNVTRVVTRNLNRVIDSTYYPIPEAKNSNLKHRPIGIGVQGLADMFAILKLSFDEEEAKQINKRIFETIYKGAIDASIELARTEGPYESYQGSPSSCGRLQFDLWGVSRDTLYHDWSGTFEALSTFGLRNSLLLAPMPTASTSQILGNNECFEPFTSNLYTRRTLAGEFIVANKWLQRDLMEIGLWNESMRQRLIQSNGSVANFADVPEAIRLRYRTVWEIPMRSIIDMAADRGPFICQSQSMNLYFENVTEARLTSAHFYGWKKGLKTGSYYIRTQSAVDAIKFTLNKDAIQENKQSQVTKFSNVQSKEIKEEISGLSSEPQACSIDDPNCEACGA
jgi:ribonucleoside-diphosphate reductase alpha subunit